MKKTQANRNTPQGDTEMSTTTIDYSRDIAAVSGDFPEQVVTLAVTSDEVVLTCDGTVVRGRISMNDPSSNIHLSPELREAIYGETSPLSPVSRGLVTHGIVERAIHLFDLK